MSNTPTIAQYKDSQLSVIAPCLPGGDPTIIVENAVAPEPFYFEIDLTAFENLHYEDDEDDSPEHTENVAEILTRLDDEFNVFI